MSEQGHSARDRGDSSGPIDLRQRQSDFYEEYFRKGVEFTKALLTENDQLRNRLTELEELARRSEAAGKVELADQYQRIECDHHDLACLFVTQTQLGRALEVREATTVITEVLLNFVGADCFAIYVTNGSALPKPLYAYGAERDDLGEPAESITAAASTGTASIDGVGRRTVSEEPLVSFPLQTAEGSFGAVVIWSFLPQKQRLEPVDQRLFDVVSWAGGSALEVARLRGAPKSTEPPDRLSALSLLLGLS